MTDSWVEVRLRDIAEAHKQGINPTAMSDEVVDHYSLPAFDNGRTPERVPASVIKSSKLLVPEGAVLVSRLNPHIPRIWSPVIDPSVTSMCSSEFAVLTATACHPPFLPYFIQSEAIYGRLGETMNGTSSSHQRVALKDLLDMAAPLPPISAQRSIAEVLGVLDDRIASLVATERLLLDYGLTQLEIALDVSDVRLMRVDEIATFENRKRIPLSLMERDKRPGPYPYYGATGIFGYVDDYLFDEFRVLVGEDGSVIEDDGTPVLQMAHGKYWVNNHAHVLAGRAVATEALWFLLRNLAVDPAVTGAVQPKLSMGRLAALDVLVPPESSTFFSVAKECVAQVLYRREQLRELVEVRTFLLPRLLSGELRVAAAEHLEEAAT